MVEDRPWREPRSSEEALAELRECAGTQFDPSLVDVFCRRFFCEIGAVRFGVPLEAPS
jgi:HD-GYP domain-containing protein (c-di-GMP phosphodiesterase class II)